MTHELLVHNTWLVVEFLADKPTKVVHETTGEC